VRGRLPSNKPNISKFFGPSIKGLLVSKRRRAKLVIFAAVDSSV